MAARRGGLARSAVPFPGGAADVDLAPQAVCRPRIPPAGLALAAAASSCPGFLRSGGILLIRDCAAHAGQCPRWGALVVAEASVPS